MRAAIRVAYARRRNAGGNSFFKTYRDDPVAFVHDCFDWKEGEGPTAYQDEILAELPIRRRVSVRGPHGLGKTTTESQAVIWFATTRDGTDWKCPTTASAWRQLTHYLWPEIHKWARRLKWQMIGRMPFNPRTELMQLSLRLRTGEAFAVSSDTPEYIEGAHADSIFYSFDESKKISPAIFDAAEGAFSAEGLGEAYALAISTPGEPVGRFYDIHSRKPGYEDWWVRHVTLDEAIAAKRISPHWAEQRRKQWGEDSAIYQNRVLGNFATGEEDGVIPLAWVELAVERWHELKDKDKFGPLTRLSGDIARGGGDNTVLARRHGWAIKSLDRFHRQDTMVTAGRIGGILIANPEADAIIDVIGVGAGVFDRLREQGYDVEPFNAAEKTDKKDKSKELGFINKRSAAWWNLHDLLDPANGEEVALPPDDNLIGDLVSIKWTTNSSGKIQVEAKDDVAERLGRSPDDGDAVVMAFWEERSKMPTVSFVSMPKTSLWRGSV